MLLLPVVDDNQRFKGIITRKEILKAVNHMAHELEKHHLVLPKSEEEMKSNLNKTQETLLLFLINALFCMITRSKRSAVIGRI